MVDTPSLLAERLHSEGEKTTEFFRALVPEDWEQVVYSDGAQWRVREVLAHFVTAEESLLRLVDNIAGGGTGSPDDFDLDEFNNRKVKALENSNLEGLLELFWINRQKTIALVKNLNPVDLMRQGRHPFLGVASLVDIIKLIYRHNQIHLRDLRRILSA